MTEKHALWAALSAAQSEFPPIPRSKEVSVRTDKGAYKFKYAPLEAIFSAVRPALSKNGLSVFHRIEYHEGRALIVAVLAHKEGGFVECPFVLPLAGKMQEQGSALTYGRRYTLQCVLGIAADDDDDANAADGNHIEDSRETGGGTKRPVLAPSPADKKADEIEAAFRGAKSLALLAAAATDNKAHIDAMDNGLQARLRATYSEYAKKFERKAT